MPPLPRRNRLLHQLAPTLDQLDRIGERQAFGRDQRGIFAQAVPGDERRARAPSASQRRQSAIETVRMAGWVLSVWFRRSSGPFWTSAQVVTERLGGLGEGIAHQRLLGAQLGQHAEGLRTWPGKTNARDADIE